MSEHDGPLVIALAVALAPSEGFLAAVERVVPYAEVVMTPYTESDALRSSRGHNGGRNAEGLDTPPIDDATRHAWKRADVLVAIDVPDGLAELMPRLRWLQSITAGYDKYDVVELARLGVRLSTASGIGAASISEFVMARILQEYKQLRAFDAQQERSEWTGHFGTELTGRTIGIAGLGAIGRAVARRARAFDMTVLATRASARSGDIDADVDELFPTDALDTMLGRCDVVVSSLPSNPSTIDLFDRDRFAAMRPGAIFCNVGRGAHVVEADLIVALESGHLRAAALDVTHVEPLPPGDPLWAAPNLYLSPHSSVSLDRYMTNLEALLLENLRRFVDGGDLVNEVAS